MTIERHDYPPAAAELWPRHRNLRLRPAKPALGRGRLQRQIRRAFIVSEVLSSSQIYDWCYAGKRLPLSTRQRYSVWRILNEVAEPVGHSLTIGRPWLWRLRAENTSAMDD
jgi:hypothetical protein